MNVRSLFSSETSSDEVANPGKVEEHQFGNELCPLGESDLQGASYNLQGASFEMQGALDIQFNNQKILLQSFLLILM